MNPLSEWPALDCEHLPASIEYQRGVWGKVHGAPTDYRWIARSADFGRHHPDLHRQLSFGGEDLPVRFQAWRNLGDRCYAVGAYPSRAIDAGGRRGFLEKQILEWHVPAGTPPVAGALSLLPHVAAMGDNVWWNRVADETWSSSPDSDLPIAAADHQPLPMDLDALAGAIACGRDALRQVIEAPALRAFYAQLLAGRSPAFLYGLPEPLSAEALVALLLPLPRAIVDRVSVAGWIPSSQPAFDDLGARWDIVMIARPSGASPSPSQFDSEAEAMAGRLLHDTAARRSPRPQSPAAPRSAPVAVRVRPGVELDLELPMPGAPTILRQLYEFARAVDRRWLTPEDLDDGVPLIEEHDPAANMLCNWVLEVGTRQPPWVDERQWGVKVDLLRSAALVLAPHRPMLQVGMPARGGRVPALFFGLRLGHNQWDRLGGVGENALRDLVEQTLEVRISRWGDRLNGWLSQWSATSRSQMIRGVLDRAIKQHRQR